MSIQIVHDQSYFLSIALPDCNIFKEVSPVFLCFSFSDFYDAFSS